MSLIRTAERSKLYSRFGTGTGFPSLLALLYIGLKLTGYIDWSWVWVLSPLWICWTMAFILLLILAGMEPD